MVSLYLLWSIERVGVLFDLPTIADKDWYRWGAEVLVANQSDQGAWPEGGGYPGATPPINTSLALLFLRRANLVFDLTTRLPFKPNDLGQSIEDTVAPPKATPPRRPRRRYCQSAAGRAGRASKRPRRIPRPEAGPRGRQLYAGRPGRRHRPSQWHQGEGKRRPGVAGPDFGADRPASPRGRRRGAGRPFPEPEKGIGGDERAENQEGERETSQAAAARGAGGEKVNRKNRAACLTNPSRRGYKG